MTEPEVNSPPLSEFGKPSSTPQTGRLAGLVEVIKALAVIQDGLRQFAMAGGFLKAPYVNANGILILAIKLRGHSLGVGPEGNLMIDGISVMEGRLE